MSFTLPTKEKRYLEAVMRLKRMADSLGGRDSRVLDRFCYAVLEVHRKRWRSVGRYFLHALTRESRDVWWALHFRCKYWFYRIAYWLSDEEVWAIFDEEVERNWAEVKKSLNEDASEKAEAIISGHSPTVIACPLCDSRLTLSVQEAKDDATNAPAIDSAI